MVSPTGEQAIADAIQYGRALFKFISPNDAGLTGSHQCGFYLPISAWQLYSPHPPERGANNDSFADVLWQDGRVTHSRVIWYGSKTRREYRLTRFGRDFPFLNADAVGSLFILIPITIEEFRAYVLEFEEDIAEFQAALGVEAIGTWGVYEAGQQLPVSEDECINREFRTFTQVLSIFPVTKAIALEVQRVLDECVREFRRMNADEKLMRYITEEFTLFKMIERKLTEPEISRLFKDVDDFIATANSITNRRKSRAGKSLEHHVERILTDAGIPFDPKPKIDGRVEPDILIPGKTAYDDATFPDNRLVIVGLKTTCKDRWRQVLNEGKRVRRKHILTLQQGISSGQLREMNEAQITLVVPRELQRYYPAQRNIPLLTVEGFIESVRSIIV